MDAREAFVARLQSHVLAEVPFYSVGRVNGDLRYICLSKQSCFVVDMELSEPPVLYHYAWLSGVVLDESDDSVAQVMCTERPDLLIRCVQRKKLVDELQIHWKADSMMRRARVEELSVRRGTVDSEYMTTNALLDSIAPPPECKEIQAPQRYKFFATDGYSVSNATETEVLLEFGQPSKETSSKGESKKKEMAVRIAVGGEEKLGEARMSDMDGVRVLGERIAEEEAQRTGSQYIIRYTGSYRKKQNLTSDPSAWFCWEMELVSAEARLALIVARRKHIPPDFASYHEFCFLLRESISPNENTLVDKYKKPLTSSSRSLGDTCRLGDVHEIREALDRRQGEGIWFSARVRMVVEGDTEQLMNLLVTTYAVYMLKEGSNKWDRQVPLRRISHLAICPSHEERKDALLICVSCDYDIEVILRGEKKDDCIHEFQRVLEGTQFRKLVVKEVDDWMEYCRGRETDSGKIHSVEDLRPDILDHRYRSGSRDAKGWLLLEVERAFDTIFSTAIYYYYDILLVSSMLEALQCDKQVYDWCEACLKLRPLLLPIVNLSTVPYDCLLDRAALFFRSVVEILGRTSLTFSTSHLDDSLPVIQDPFVVVRDIETNCDSPALTWAMDTVADAKKMDFHSDDSDDRPKQVFSFARNQSEVEKNEVFKDRVSRYLAYCVDGGHGTFTKLDSLIDAMRSESISRDDKKVLKKLLEYFFHLRPRNGVFTDQPVEDRLTETGFLASPFVLNVSVFEALLKREYFLKDVDLPFSLYVEFLCAILQQGRTYRAVHAVLRELARISSSAEERNVLMSIDILSFILPYFDANDLQLDYFLLKTLNVLCSVSSSLRRALVLKGKLHVILKRLSHGSVEVASLALSVLRSCISASDVRKQGIDTVALSAPLLRLLQPSRIHMEMHRSSSLLLVAFSTVRLLAGEREDAEDMTRTGFVEVLLGWLELGDPLLLDNVGTCLCELAHQSKSIRRYVASQPEIISNIVHAILRTKDPFAVRSLTAVLAMLSAQVEMVPRLSKSLDNRTWRHIDNVCEETDAVLERSKQILGQSCSIPQRTAD